jgi:hypothetical protein
MMPLKQNQTLTGGYFSKPNQSGGGGGLTGSNYPTGGGVLQPSGSRVFVDGSRVLTRLPTGAIG